MVIPSFKLIALLLLALLMGYAAAYIPALQIPAFQSFHRWRPSAAVSRSAPEIQGIGWVGTRTPYFDETITFFRDVLHLPLTLQSSQFVEFRLASGERLGIFAQRSPDVSFMKGPMMEFAVADVDRARSQLEASGVRFISETHRDPASGLTWAEFWGPDGYPYGLTSTPNQGR
jgi:predicted enzyme related to lactoylglutathione lyase